MQCPKVRSGHITMSDVVETTWLTPKSRICYYSEENDINLLFDREPMAAILDFIHNTMS